MPDLAPTLAYRIMWSRKNSFEAMRLSRVPAFAALLKDHLIVVAGQDGWGSVAYCDRILGISLSTGRMATPSNPMGKQALLAWAGANGCPWSVAAKGSVVELPIPDGIASLGDHAFEKCTNLVMVRLPRSLTRIGASAFSDCSSLATVDFSAAKHLTRIEPYAFCRAALS
jgi:hypothetical protein